MNFALEIWRQKNAGDKGEFVSYSIKDIPGDCIVP